MAATTSLIQPSWEPAERLLLLYGKRELSRRTPNDRVAKIMRAMSQDDVDIVKEFTRRFAAGRHVTDDYFDQNIVWDTSASGLPSAGVYHGREGVRRFFREWLAPWTDYAIEARDCIDAGGAVVLVFRQTGTGKESGVRTERDFFAVWNSRTRRSCASAFSRPANRPSKPQASRGSAQDEKQ